MMTQKERDLYVSEETKQAFMLDFAGKIEVTKTKSSKGKFHSNRQPKKKVRK